MEATLIIQGTPAQVAALPEWVRAIFRNFIGRLALAAAGQGPAVSIQDIAEDFQLKPESVDGAIEILFERGIFCLQSPAVSETCRAPEASRSGPLEST